jgi:hypothetical protein
MSRYLPVLLISVILGGHLVSAQVTTGTISGVVQDPSGAAIAGAAITVRNLDTGTARSVISDAGGRYTAPDLSLGTYEVQAQQSGFQTEVRTGITLTVGREAVVNLALRVGQDFREDPGHRRSAAGGIDHFRHELSGGPENHSGPAAERQKL